MNHTIYSLKNTEFLRKFKILKPFNFGNGFSETGDFQSEARRRLRISQNLMRKARNSQ